MFKEGGRFDNLTLIDLWPLMKKMFYNAKKFNKDISKWNVSKVLDMGYMFNYAQDFKQNINTQQVTVGENTYLAWDVSNVPLDKSKYMFYKVTAIPRWYSTEKRMIKKAPDGKWYDFVQNPIVEYDIIPNFNIYSLVKSNPF